MLIETSHPIKYSDLIEEKIISNCGWYLSENNSEIMMSDERLNCYDNFYHLFFPIFTESHLSEDNEIQYKKYKIYLINHSKDKKFISLPMESTTNIIYIVNNSNAELLAEDYSISLSKKRGKSLYIEGSNKIGLIQSNNIQTCMVVLKMIKSKKEKIVYR